METGSTDGTRRWLPSSGFGASLGALLWTAMPGLQTATMGTRHYVGTAFDVGSFVGWLLMVGGLARGNLTYFGRYGRLGRAGFRPVPATGEMPGCSSSRPSCRSSPPGSDSGRS